MLLSVVLKPFLRISKINLRCFQNKYVVFQKRITSSFEIHTKVFSMPMQVNLRIISSSSEINLALF